MSQRIKAVAAIVATVVSTAAAAQSASLEHFLEQWDGNGDAIVTGAEIRQGREQRFYAFDVDGNGYIDQQEYARFDKVREAGIARFSPEDQVNIRRVAKGLTREWNDADGDGRVSRAEFLDGGDTWLKALDKDGDGAVTLKDLGP
ncbi:EF-hand domain-containing protein [Rhodopseudomonas pseudopalustris]|uniref:EF hand n=1 Tax=Rhodopseudomonas pseudopalustris TaxID=1513892 RepID=A0A1H8V484_9BRAD|nr:EF-hand domain-containing protein [Rhodopseudomonas pseudopalustris]MBB1093273.1 EF-hand domain-containing protein [Rhodopseudomonas palustris]SEP10201.1 EF hand [Rhodopseudomonas pseudopalustris]